MLFLFGFVSEVGRESVVLVMCSLKMKYIIVSSFMARIGTAIKTIYKNITNINATCVRATIVVYRLPSQRSFFFSPSLAGPRVSDWSSAMATMMYPTRTTFAMIAASAPAYVEFPVDVCLVGGHCIVLGWG